MSLDGAPSQVPPAELVGLSERMIEVLRFAEQGWVFGPGTTILALRRRGFVERTRSVPGAPCSLCALLTPEGLRLVEAMAVPERSEVS